MVSSMPTADVLAAMFVWPLILGHDDQALMTIQCGMCGEDIMPADGWPVRYTFTMAYLNRILFTHITDKGSDPAHSMTCLLPDVHHYPCGAYRIGEPDSCLTCYAEGRRRDALIDQAPADPVDPAGVS